ncbi:MAG: hypothetical protein AAFY72_17745 [Cyanobacteria bacterium J06649_4]
MGLNVYLLDHLLIYLSTSMLGRSRSVFGPEFEYYRERGAQIPSGMISRYPIIDSGEWNDSQVSNQYAACGSH